MTVRVRYTNPLISERSFSEEDFKRHGVTNQGAVSFGPDNDFTAELSEEAFAYLKGIGEPFVEVSVSAEPEPEDQGQGELDFSEEVPYANLSKSELQDIIDERNEGRHEEDQLRRTGTIATLAALLEADDQSEDA